MSDILHDLELVHRQLYCVIHLSKVAIELSEAHLKHLPKCATDPALGHHLIKMTGDFAYHFMEQVGDLLNARDAVTPEDEKRWEKTFKDAHERWKNLTAELNAKQP